MKAGVKAFSKISDGQEKRANYIVERMSQLEQRQPDSNGQNRGGRRLAF